MFQRPPEARATRLATSGTVTNRWPSARSTRRISLISRSSSARCSKTSNAVTVAWLPQGSSAEPASSGQLPEMIFDAAGPLRRPGAPISKPQPLGLPASRRKSPLPHPKSTKGCDRSVCRATAWRSLAKRARVATSPGPDAVSPGALALPMRE